MENKNPQPNNPLTKLFADLDGHLINSVKREDFERFGKILLDTIKKLESRMAENMAQNRDVSASSVKQMQKDIATLKSTTEGLIASFSETNDSKLNKAVEQLRTEVNRVREAIPTLPDYTDIFNEIQAKIPVLPPEKLGEDYRNALEALPDGDKLAIEAIEDLRKELDELRKMKTGGGNGLAFREFVTKFDLSPYLDGVTKTFNIPGTYAILSVASSSFPSVLRPTIDYTHTQSTITFTDEITADTTLAQGQTVIIMLINA